MDQNRLVKHTEILGDHAQEVPADLQKVMDAVHEYVGQKKISYPQEMVTFIILLSAIMDVDETVFMQSMARMNKIMISRIMNDLQGNGPVN